MILGVHFAEDIFQRDDEMRCNPENPTNNAEKIHKTPEKLDKFEKIKENWKKMKTRKEIFRPVRDLNPGPLASYH